MSDRRRREAERLAAAGGAYDAARVLRERVRAGELSLDRLTLAAYLDHLPARLACSQRPGWACGPECGEIETDEGPVFVHDQGCGRYVDLWYEGFLRWGPDVRLRALLATVERPERCLGCRATVSSTLSLVGGLVVFDDCPCAARCSAFNDAERCLERPDAVSPEALEAFERALRRPRDPLDRQRVIACLLPHALGQPIDPGRGPEAAVA